MEQLSVADIEGVVNSGAGAPYSAAEIMALLEVMFIFSSTKPLVYCMDFEKYNSK